MHLFAMVDIWPCFTSRSAIALKFSRLSQHGRRPISLRGCPILETMSGPCWGHVWPSFTSRPARALNFSRLSQHGRRPMSMEFLCLEPISTQLKSTQSKSNQPNITQLNPTQPKDVYPTQSYYVLS